MKQIFVLVLLVIVNSVSAQKETQYSLWRTEAISVDGSGSEWEMPLSYNDERLSYSLSNDNESFTLLIQSFNRSVQQKIMRSGMIVTLSTTGKNKRKITVLFPLSSATSENRERLTPDPEGNPPGIDQRSSMRKQFIDRCTEMKIKGVKSIKGNLPISNEYGFLAAINWETETLLSYELQLPIKELIASADPGDFAGTEIEIKIQVNPLPQPNSGGGQVAPAGGSGGRGGNRGGGGASSAPAGGRPGGDRAAMFTPDIFKTKFILSRSE